MQNLRHQQRLTIAMGFNGMTASGRKIFLPCRQKMPSRENFTPCCVVTTANSEGAKIMKFTVQTLAVFLALATLTRELISFREFRDAFDDSLI